MVATGKNSLEVARQHRFEWLFVLPFRVLRCHGLDLIKGDKELKRIGSFGPQRAVIVKGGNALCRRDVVWTACCRDACDEVENRLLRRAIVPGGQGIIGRGLVALRQRRVNVAGSNGAVEEVTGNVAQIRRSRPKVRIILRADGGFCNDLLMSWCEANRVDYVFGLARNSRLEAALGEQLAQAKDLCLSSGKPAQVFCDFHYRTLDSWSRTRRIVGKAEHTLDLANPRFVVTSLKRARAGYDARSLYEDLHCDRGWVENRTGEQFEMLAGRALSATMAVNQLRLWFSTMTCVLVDTLHRVGLRHTQFAKAAAQTIRLKLLKLGAQVRTNARRIHFTIASSCPNQAEFALAHIYLQRAFGSA